MNMSLSAATAGTNLHEYAMNMSISAATAGTNLHEYAMNMSLSAATAGTNLHEYALSVHTVGLACTSSLAGITFTSDTAIYICK